MSATEIKKTCCRLCSFLCPVQVQVMNGEVVKVEADPIVGSEHRFICERAVLGAIDFHNHAHRLNYPLKRSGAKGKGNWQRISWPQAMNEIAEKLGNIRDKHGPEAIAVARGHGSGPFAWATYRWCNLFGTPNIQSSTKPCWQPQLTAELAVYGSDTYPNDPRPGVTRCMVVFGGNPYETRPPAWRLFVQAKKQGAKLIVIDPRRTRTAEMADLWLQIRPGSDGALAYAMLNVIIEEELYDKQFVQKWCAGFEQFAEFVRGYSPEAVEATTWVPAKEVIEAARMYATNSPAIMQAMWGVSHSQLGKGRTLCVNLAKSILRAITGNLDVEGGERLRGSLMGVNYAQNMHWDRLLDHPLRKKDTIGADRFPAASVRSFRLYRETWQKVFGEAGYPLDYAVGPSASPHFIWSGITKGEPYPIKALLVTGTNVLCTRSDTRSIYEALTSDNLDLLVTMDVCMTPDAMLSDYVLPAADWMERPYMSPAYPCQSIGEQAVSPMHERRNDYELWRDLGRRLGQGEHWPDEVEEMYDRFLMPMGLTFRELVRKVRWEGGVNLSPVEASVKEYEKTGFATPSGKVELVPTLLKELGYEVLPHYQELAFITTEDFPLILTTGGRVRAFFHSTLREVPKLRQRHPDPLVQIHPDTAREHQIVREDWVIIETHLGRIRQKVEITDRIHPKVVHSEFGWWFPEEEAKAPHLFGIWKSNAEVILADDVDLCDFQGQPPLRAVPCRISRADAGIDREA